ncbi:UbiD family decarboxylase [Sporosarcina sp. FSL K6-3508]|uniref:UbiD family decarboxylase n=1 Tax=Sporosarcina sp. FSL K6-3508 TaxID=2921557 RepID=UPI00315A8599
MTKTVEENVELAGKITTPTYNSNLAKRNVADLQGVVQLLKEKKMLVRVKSPVDIKHEMAGIATRFDGGKAVLFEKLKNTDVSLLTGLYWNREVLAEIFNVKEKDLPFLSADSIEKWSKNPIEPIVVENGPANEVIIKNKENLLKDIPIPTHGLQDGGPYLDSCVLIAKDPETGVRNASIQRLMVTGPNRMTMLMDMGRHLRDYYERAEKMNKPLEITINNGVGLPVHFASTTPSSAAPIDADELGVASQLLGEPLKLLRSQTVNVEGVADAQYVIEAEILPHIRENEGPAAEVTGYYAAADDRWVVNVKAVTRRKQPIFHTIMPGKEVYNAVGLMAEASVYQKVSSMVPDVIDVYLSYGGCGFYHANVQIKKSSEGVQKNAIMATFAAFPPLRRVTIVDEDVNIYDPEDIEWALATRHDPERDMILISDARGHELNPITNDGIGTKIGIDATAPYPRPWEFQRLDMKEVMLENYDIEE